MEKPIQQKRKILRRPMIACQTTEFGVGLLRMTSFVPFPNLKYSIHYLQLLQEHWIKIHAYSKFSDNRFGFFKKHDVSDLDHDLRV